LADSSLPEKLEVLWTFKGGDAFEGAAAISGGVVYAGCIDGHLYAIDIRTGAEKWRYAATPVKPARDKIEVAPIKNAAAVRGGSVYVGDYGGVFHCVDAATGKARWRFETPSGAEISSSANLTDDAILFGSGDETLYCLGLDGKPRWKFKVAGGPVMGSPALGGGRTFVSGCDSSLHVLDVKTGKELAAVALGGQTGASAAVVGDRLYVGTMTNEVLAVDLAKADVAWRYQPAKRQQPFYASAAVTDTLVIVGSRDKRVHALDRASGKEVWTANTEGRVDSSPVVAGGRVFVGSGDGNLYEIDLAKGTQRNKFPLGKSIVASPAVAEGRLVIGTEEGELHCLGSK
jgi:outer membrane protein assembly factor BamB